MSEKDKNKMITRRDALKNIAVVVGAVATTTMMGAGVADAGTMTKT